MKRLIKGFSQFVNESRGTRIDHFGNLITDPDLSGQAMPFHHIAYLSDEQIEDLDLSDDDIIDMDDAFDEVMTAMVDPLLQKIGFDDRHDEMLHYDVVYYDITVDLVNGTYTLHGVYEATATDEYLRINKPIKVSAQLPITLPIPDLVSGILQYGENCPNIEDLRRLGLTQGSVDYQRIDGPSKEEREELTKLAKEWSDLWNQRPRDAQALFGDEKMKRLNYLSIKVCNPRNRR
jgi:hypothetical protein